MLITYPFEDGLNIQVVQRKLREKESVPEKKVVLTVRGIVYVK